MGKERLTQLQERIVPNFSLPLVVGVVIEMEETEDETEPISLHDLHVNTTVIGMTFVPMQVLVIFSVYFYYFRHIRWNSVCW